jgi:hypothetical protein
MKRLLSICLLTFCLSFPVFGGHTQTGGWCADGMEGCIPDSHNMNGNQQVAPSELGSEMLLSLLMLLMLLRYKA